MKVLSVRQPWAWAIIHGGKDVENRNWATKYRGPLAIHAGRQFDMGKRDWHDFSTGAYGEPWHTMAREYNKQPDHILGAIIGIVDLVDCIPDNECSSIWKAGGSGFFCWKIENPRPLPVPHACLGQLGLFEVEVPE